MRAHAATRGFLLLIGVAALKSDKAQTVDRRADVEHVGSAAALSLSPLENRGDVGSGDLEFLCRPVGIVEDDAVAGMGDLPRLVPGVNGAHEHRHSLPDAKSDGYLLAPQTLGSAARGVIWMGEDRPI